MSEPGFPVYSPEIKRVIQEKVHLCEDIVPIDVQMADFAIENNELDDLRERIEDDINNVDFSKGDHAANLSKRGFFEGVQGPYMEDRLNEGQDPSGMGKSP